MDVDRQGAGGPEALIEADGPVLRFTIDRPAVLNAIDESVERALSEAVGRFERDSALRVLVIRARGAYFSAGYDMHYRVDEPHAAGGVALRRRYREVHELFDRIERVENRSSWPRRALASAARSNSPCRATSASRPTSHRSVFPN